MFKKIFIVFIIIFSLVSFSYANTDLFVYKSKTFFKASENGYPYNFEELYTEIIFNTFNEDEVKIIQQGMAKSTGEFMYLYFIDYNDDFDISNSNIFVEKSYTDLKRYSQMSFKILDKDEFIEYFERFNYFIPEANLDFNLNYKKVILVFSFGEYKDRLIKFTFQYYKESKQQNNCTETESEEEEHLLQGRPPFTPPIIPRPWGHPPFGN